jgi:hypothetical protein
VYSTVAVEQQEPASPAWPLGQSVVWAALDTHVVLERAATDRLETEFVVAEANRTAIGARHLLHVLLQIFHLIIAALLGSVLSLSLDLTVQLLLLLLTCSSGGILFLVGGIHQVLNEVLKEQYFLDTECFNI